ncbi:FGGY-family carbohydrate kinase [Caproiciproducens sp. R1]|uniref:FGGY-family carbohydrate kinase n=1 Tax=Caproiciproducens sp. R1 TaxID=3435000 RepID=UPI00403420A1
MKYFLGIDNGGTYTKSVVFDQNGKEVGSASGQIPMITPKAQYTERDMDYLWQENVRSIKNAVLNAGIDSADIKGISFSGHGKGIYLWGKDGKPAYNGIMSTDGRAYEYPVRWEKDGTADKLFKKTYQKILTCQPISLLKWFQENDPSVLENTRWIFGSKDYIRFRLTGEANAEMTDFSGSNLVNLKTASYDYEILKFLGLEEVRDKLPPLKYSTELCGRVTEKASRETGLAAGTPCAAGMFDIDACAIAMGITNSDNLAVIAGTWSINEYISKTPILDKSVMMNSLYCMPGYYLIEESSPTSASNHEWYINMFMKHEKAECKEKGESVYKLADKMVAAIAPEEQDIIFLPYIYGSNYNSRGKAALVGMDSHHTDAHILRSVYEGIVFCHKVHLEKLLKNCDQARAVRLAGGVCNAPVWIQIFADVFNLPVELIDTRELGAFGAAMAASVVSGEYENLEKAAKDMVKLKDTVYPLAENVPVYQKKYERYLKVSNALEDYWND